MNASYYFLLLISFLLPDIEDKFCINPIMLNENPYNNDYLNIDNVGVCALNNINASSYIIKTFYNIKEAKNANFSVMHDTPCGTCSTIQDLKVYTENLNLVALGTRCAIIGSISEVLGISCFKYSGFTENCAKIWHYNAQNTRKQCFFICLIHIGIFYNNNDGTLNNCLQCDEKNSGMIFKKYAGRTRRNSGIVSDIYRFPHEIFNKSLAKLH